MSALATAAHQHALYVLLDSNLPTGGFVASSGLESYAKHGLLRAPAADPYHGAGASRPASYGGTAGTGSTASAAGPSSAPALGPAKMAAALMDFAGAEVANYATSTGYYLARAHGVMAAHLAGSAGSEEPDGAVERLRALDAAHEATLLSHVARRASRTQGIAVLTLHARGLSLPPGYDGGDGGEMDGSVAGGAGVAERAGEVVGAYKRLIRLGRAEGHLAVCWGIMTAALGLDLATSTHVYLFTHARSLLSAAVRLNLVGPYLSTQLLAHPMRRVIDGAGAAVLAGAGAGGAGGAGGTGGAGEAGEPAEPGVPGEANGEAGERGDGGATADIWAWAAAAERGPATTWPLGEILVARHDLQHSRIFNS